LGVLLGLLLGSLELLQLPEFGFVLLLSLERCDRVLLSPSGPIDPIPLAGENLLGAGQKLVEMGLVLPDGRCFGFRALDGLGRARLRLEHGLVSLRLAGQDDLLGLAGKLGELGLCLGVP
jgi:hypothetical protein